MKSTKQAALMTQIQKQFASLRHEAIAKEVKDQAVRTARAMAGKKLTYKLEA